MVVIVASSIGIKKKRKEKKNTLNNKLFDPLFYKTDNVHAYVTCITACMKKCQEIISSIHILLLLDGRVCARHRRPGRRSFPPPSRSAVA